MGGSGSGRTGWRPVAERLLRLDMVFLHREKLLRPGMTVLLNWSWHDMPLANIKLLMSTSFVRLRYSTIDGEMMDYPIYIDRTPCHYGGSRTWFLCPRCCRRAAVLFAGRHFMCRQCHALAYAVENEGEQARLLRRANKLRGRINAPAAVMTSLILKPKGMHQKTFNRILLEIEELDNRFWLHAMEAFSVRL